MTIDTKTAGLNKKVETLNKIFTIDNTSSTKYYPITDKFYEIEIDKELTADDVQYSQIFNLGVPLDLVNNCYLGRAFEQYGAFCCDSVEVLVKLSTVPDTSGSYLFGFVPMVNKDASVSEIPGNNYPRFYSVEDVVNVDLSVTKAFLIKIPWWYYKSHMSTKGDPNAKDMDGSIGRLVCMTNVPVLATVGTSQTVPISMSVRFINSEFLYPLSQCTETLEAEQKFYKAARSVKGYRDQGAKTSKTTKHNYNIFLSGDNNAIQVAPEETNDFETGGTSASVSMTKGADFDKPGYRAPPIPVIDSDESLNRIDGPYKTEFMGPLHQMAKLGALVPPKDVEAYSYIFSRPVPVVKTTITTDTVLHETLMALLVSPSPILNSVPRAPGANTNIPVSPSDYLSLLYGFWNGQIKIKLKFYGNIYQSFSIRIACTRGANLSQLIDRSQQTMQGFVDFEYTKENREVEFIVSNENLGLYFYTTPEYWENITMGDIYEYFSSVITVTLTKTLQTTGLNRVVVEAFYDCSDVKFYGKTHFKAIPHEAPTLKKETKTKDYKSSKTVTIPKQKPIYKTKNFVGPPAYEDESMPIDNLKDFKGQTLNYYSHNQEIRKTYYRYKTVTLTEGQSDLIPMKDILGSGVLDYLLSMYTMIRGGLAIQIYSHGDGLHTIYWDPIPYPSYVPTYALKALDGCNKVEVHQATTSVNITVPYSHTLKMLFTPEVKTNNILLENFGNLHIVANHGTRTYDIFVATDDMFAAKFFIGPPAIDLIPTNT